MRKPKRESRKLMTTYPLLFELNEGQSDPRVKFWRAEERVLSFSLTAAVLTLATAQRGIQANRFPQKATVEMKLLGANPKPVVRWMNSQ